MNQRISSIESSKPSVSAPAAKKQRKSAAKSTVSAEDKPKRPANAWILFTQRVRGLLKENGYTKEAVGIEANMFSSTLKEENSDLTSWSNEDILARRADWSRPAVSKWVATHGVKSKASSVVSGEAPEAAETESAEKPKKARKNPWEGLSEEQKAERIAKMKAGKAAKKAAAEGSADAEEEAPVSPKVKAEAAPKASAPKEVAAKPSSPKPSSSKAAEAPKASSKSNAAAAPAVAAAPAASGQFKPVLLQGVRYLVNMESGHAYHRNDDGSQGDWAGIFSRTPKPHVDSSVPEPGAEEEELNFDDE
jgi:hypothetical protein